MLEQETLQTAGFALLQAIEDKHLQAALAQDDISGSSSSGSGTDSDDDSSDAELDAAIGADLDQHVDDAIVRAANQQHMNTSLLSMYSSPARPMPSVPSASDLVSQDAAPPHDDAAGNGQPAFAPPRVVEAAARRALAAEKAQQQALQAAKRGNGCPVADDTLPSTSGQLSTMLLSGYNMQAVQVVY